MKKRHNAPALGFRIGQADGSLQYRHLEIAIYSGRWENLSRTYEESGEAYHLEKLQIVRETTGQTWVFVSDDRPIRVQWQTHRRDSDDPFVRDGAETAGDWTPWYGSHIEDARFDAETVRLLQRMMAAHRRGRREGHQSPEEWLQTLAEMHAVPVAYYSDAGIGRFIEDEGSTLDRLTPADETAAA